jgi:hypothetical protein
MPFLPMFSSMLRACRGGEFAPYVPVMDILENASVQAAAMSRRRRRPRLPSAGQERRIEELRRAFQRNRPTLIEKAAMLRAAALVARAEALALDPNADVGEVVKLNNLAGRALRSLTGERRAHVRFDPDAPLPRFEAHV